MGRFETLYRSANNFTDQPSAKYRRAARTIDSFSLAQCWASPRRTPAFGIGIVTVSGLDCGTCEKVSPRTAYRMVLARTP
jgi:hypothetical protein